MCSAAVPRHLDRVTTGGESGLLSMAFARDYRTSRRFWVYYTDQQGFLQIDQFRASAGAPTGLTRARGGP